MNEIDSIKNDLQKTRFITFDQYISEILTAFRIPNVTIQRLLTNASKNAYKTPIYVYRRATIVFDTTLKSINDIEEVEQKSVVSFRLLVIVNDKIVVCKDSVTGDSISFTPNDIHNYVQFFFPLIYGEVVEKDIYSTVDFAELLNKLFNQLSLDELNKHSVNAEQLSDFVLSLVYLSFAKSILGDKEIEKFIKWAVLAQNKDYDTIIAGFVNAVLNNKKSSSLHDKLPYWNIYQYTTNVLPHVNQTSFELILKIISSDLTSIDTEILGSLIYKFVQLDDTSTIYGHDTSYHNVSKVLSPLFVDNYEYLIEQNKSNKVLLANIRSDLLQLTFFDPTNGPGCFLTSAFNIIVDLVTTIDDLLDEISPETIHIRQFVALVDNRLSQKLTHLSLWISSLKYQQKTSVVHESDLYSTFNSINIHIGDQLHVDWTDICPNTGKTMIIGSPTFKGSKKVSAVEKKAMQRVFNTVQLGDVDYSSCWLYLAAKYIHGSSSKCSLVLTNSVCQGVQVAFLWKRIYGNDCDISFAYRSFKWRNGPQQNTGVSVVIIGLLSSVNDSSCKYLYTDNHKIKTNCIGPYLINGSKTIIEKRTSPLSRELPAMPKGNMPYDNQHLLLSGDEKRQLLSNNPDSIQFLRKIVGSEEFINKIERWCLWIPTEQLDKALSIPDIAERINKVRQFRLSNTDPAARKLAARSHQFREFRFTSTQTLVIPSVSSENRPYIPIGFIGKDTIVSNLAFTIYDCDPWVFGLISSRMHNVWVRTVCGCLETRIRYSSRLGYNTFPFPKISVAKKDQITSIVFDVINDRENYCDISLGALYSDLPQSLRILHNYLDECIDSCYQDAPFESDMERLKLLFSMYERIAN